MERQVEAPGGRSVVAVADPGLKAAVVRGQFFD
jgi:hypothetical protein